LVPGKEVATTIALVNKKADGGAPKDATTTLQQQYNIAVPRDDDGWASLHVLIDMSVMKNRPSNADLALAYGNAQALSFQLLWIKNKVRKRLVFCESSKG
jgi:hypothetical protein